MASSSPSAQEMNVTVKCPPRRDRERQSEIMYSGSGNRSASNGEDNYLGGLYNKVAAEAEAVA